MTVARARGRASIRVSELEAAGEDTVDLAAAIVDAANGEITVTLPSTLRPGTMPPAAAIVEGVPVVIVYVASNRGGEIRTSRFLVVLRRGTPSP